VGSDVTDTLVFLLVVGGRFLIPLLIPRFPLPAILAALVLDAADQTIFELLTDLDLEGYQSYDKALDIYYLTIAYVSVLRNWTNGFAVEVARFLWYYRLIGVVVFEATEIRAVLFIFPNTFEFFFIAYEIVRLAWDPRRLSKRAVIGIAAFIWIVIKLPQEWWIHIAQLDFTDFMKETVLGVDADDSWSTAMANRPWVVASIVAVAAGLLVLGWWWKRRLRPQDWSVRFDADRPVPHIDLPDADDTEPALRWPTFEKIALIALVASIFASFLDIGATALQIVVATAIVVLVNAGISLWAARRGFAWRSVGVEFVVLAVVNSALLVGYGALVSDGAINRAAAVFFGMLLTLVITLYDRYRGMRLDRLRSEGEQNEPAPSTA
jgi:hypothetical protein